MRDHNKAFCRAVAGGFDCLGPVYEFGSYQVAGQEQYADLRGLFPGHAFVGCDMRPGPGVDRLEDVSRLTLPDGAVGTALCIETFEHVFELRRAFDEVFRVLRPSGLFVMTAPLNFRIHGYPDDYWRMTPSCLRRLLAPYAGRVVGWQGHEGFPHTVMALAVKSPAPADFAARAERVIAAYQRGLREAEAGLPLAAKIRRLLGRFYRSKGERQVLASLFRSGFVVDAPAREAAARTAVAEAAPGRHAAHEPHGSAPNGHRLASNGHRVAGFPGHRVAARDGLFLDGPVARGEVGGVERAPTR